MHQWKSRRVDGISSSDPTAEEQELSVPVVRQTYRDPMRLRAMHFGRLWLLLTSSNTFVLLTAWSSKPETPPPKGIEAPGLIEN